MAFLWMTGHTGAYHPQFTYCTLIHSTCVEYRSTVRVIEARIIDNRDSDNRGLDNRGSDNRGSDNRGSDNRGSDNQGSDNRECTVLNMQLKLMSCYEAFSTQM